ncbi:sensor histidine kinase [Ideonella sp.]|uniref:sensor histidine kinase n=1 Tax=Ideonella sp. TaxID=1929293 RepID=UPI0035B4EAEB
MPRAWVWTQLAIGWLPMWALFTVLMMSAHQAPVDEAAPYALRLMAIAATLGMVVHRLTARLPWPHPFRLGFIAVHLLGGLVYAISWFGLNAVVESLLRGTIAIPIGPGLGPYLVVGMWLYCMVAAVAYASREAERSAQLQALAAGSQLAALRSQLHPHFLFNALHTVVQLIPLDPRGAVHAAELLAGVLRSAIGEHKEWVTLHDEWGFVQRYLEIEAIRFGERLVVRSEIDPALLDAQLPSFALQTLVENAVRHGAAPAIEPTTLRIGARLHGGHLLVEVDDDGVGADLAAVEGSAGTGLRRLRERLAWLYGGSAGLVLRGAPGQGFGATLKLPLRRAAAEEGGDE